MRESFSVHDAIHLRSLSGLHGYSCRGWFDCGQPGVSGGSPRASRPAARTLTVDHVKALVVQARSTQDCRIEHLIVLLAATGLRRSEARGLRWVDVDFDTAQLEVSGARARDSEGLRRGATRKSAAGLRHFSLASLR